MAWGGVLYYYKADRHGFVLLIASLLALGAGLLRGLGGARLALLVAALTPCQSTAMLGYALRTIMRLCRERGLHVEFESGVRVLAVAETVVLVVAAIVAAAIIAL